MKIMVCVVLGLAIAALPVGGMAPVAKAAQVSTSRPACGAITGRIIYAYKGQPFVGAVDICLTAVTAPSRHVPPAPLIFHAKTTARGKFTVRKIPPGIYRIAVRLKMRYGGGNGQVQKPVKIAASPGCVDVGTIKCAVFMQ